MRVGVNRKYFHIGNGIDKIELFPKDLNPIAVNTNSDMIHTRSSLDEEPIELPGENGRPLKLCEGHNILTYCSGRRLWVSLIQFA